MTAPHAGEDRTRPPAADGPSLTLSEERLAVSTVRVPARRVRLEKFVVTETRTVTVQVSREEVRLVEVPLSESDQTDGTGAVGAPTDPDRWLTLSEERVVITTETVPVERVRLEVSTVTEDRMVTDELRREQVAFDPATHRPRATDPGATPTTPEETA